MEKDISKFASMVESVVDNAKVTDMHTHLFAPEFGSMLLCGADELLTFHYLISESFRVHHLPYQEFWNLSKQEQSQLIWNSLFVQNSPLSEAASGVVTVAKRLGCDTGNLTLESLREALSEIPSAGYINRILDVAGVKEVVMTNDPFDIAERPFWKKEAFIDSRFHPALRLDRLMNDLKSVCPIFAEDGYEVDEMLSGRSMSEIRRFLESWIDKTRPVYVAFSVADDFTYPSSDTRGKILEQVLLPLFSERKIPLAIMVGAHRRVNPMLDIAGDSVVKASMEPIEALCAANPDNRFLVTTLSRENQHDVVIAARKFNNLMVFGCWWFVNTETMVEDITGMRMELLGPTFVPQHSDARVLEQLIYKWDRARIAVKKVLVKKYEVLLREGWEPTIEDVERDVDKLFRKNFWNFVQWK